MRYACARASGPRSGYGPGGVGGLTERRRAERAGVQSAPLRHAAWLLIAQSHSVLDKVVAKHDPPLAWKASRSMVSEAWSESGGGVGEAPPKTARGCETAD